MPFIAGGDVFAVGGAPMFFGQGRMPDGLGFGADECVFAESFEFFAVPGVKQGVVDPVGGGEEGEGGGPGEVEKGGRFKIIGKRSVGRN